MSDWKKAAQERAKSLKEGDSFKLTEGLNCFRLMPDKRGMKYPPYVEILVHRNVGPDKWFGRCGHEIDGSGKCWLCNVKIPELQKSSQSSKQMMAETLASQEQMICQVSRYDPDTKRFSAPKPWWVSNARTVRPLLLSKICDTRYSFDDPVKGYNLNIERSGMGPRNTTYDPPVRDEESTKVPQEVLNKIKAWSEFVPKYNEADMQAAYYGRSRDREDERSREAVVEEGPEEEQAETDDEEPAEEVEETEEEEVEEETEGEEEPEEEEEETEEEETEEESEEEEEIEEAEEEEEEEEFEPEPAPKRKAAPPIHKKSAPLKKQSVAPSKKQALPVKKSAPTMKSSKLKRR